MPANPLSHPQVEACLHLIAGLLAAVLLVSLGVALAWEAVKALKTGVAFKVGDRNKGYPKAEEPLKFWFILFAQIYVTLMLVIAGIRTFEKVRNMPSPFEKRHSPATT